MGWHTNDGLHEGFLLPEFADGQRGCGIFSGRVPDDQVIVDDEPASGASGAEYATRPAAEVVGWRIMCNCYSANSAGVIETWSSELLVRVPSAALEDLADARVFAPDAEVPFVDDREDVGTLARERWWREHAGGIDALGRVTDARARMATAEHDLDAAVADARATGVSWEAIGKAAGMARQSAHSRWGSTSPRHIGLS